MKSKGRGREIVHVFHMCVCMLSVCAFVPQVINFNISFIYKDIFIKVAWNVYGMGYWGYSIEKALYLSKYFTLIIGAMVSEYKDNQKSWPSNVLPEKNFSLILKNKMAAIANYLKIIKML